MPDRELWETLVRAAIVLPLSFIALQVLRLSRLLPSAAWTRLALGFGIVAILRASVLLYSPHPIVYNLVLWTAYAFLGWGFHTLTRDVNQVRDMGLVLTSVAEEEKK